MPLLALLHNLRLGSILRRLHTTASNTLRHCSSCSSFGRLRAEAHNGLPSAAVSLLNTQTPNLCTTWGNVPVLSLLLTVQHVNLRPLLQPRCCYLRSTLTCPPPIIPATAAWAAR
eukprot:365553-Chlamydomonas_euryale.AAC.2